MRLYAGASWDQNGHDWEEYCVNAGESSQINYDSTPSAQYDNPNGVPVWSSLTSTQISYMAVSISDCLCSGMFISLLFH